MMSSTAALATPVSLTIGVKPLRCGSAPTAPAPPRNTRRILPQEQQDSCVEDFHASWPVLPTSRRGGREVNFPRLSLNVQHRRSTTGANGQPTTPSPLAMLAFQRAFQKMKQQAAVNTTMATKSTKVKTTSTATTTSKPLPGNLPTMNSKPINASTAAALERLNAMAPSSSSPTSNNNTSPRKLARRRQQQQQGQQLFVSPQKPSTYANSFAKTSSSGKLNLLLGRPSALTNSPSAGRLINHNQMRRVRSSGSRGNLNQMLF